MFSFLRQFVREGFLKCSITQRSTGQCDVASVHKFYLVCKVVVIVRYGQGGAQGAKSARCSVLIKECLTNPYETREALTTRMTARLHGTGVHSVQRHGHSRTRRTPAARHRCTNTHSILAGYRPCTSAFVAGLADPSKQSVLASHLADASMCC